MVRTVNCDGEMLTVRADATTDARIPWIYALVTNAEGDFVIVASLRSLDISDEELVKTIRAAKACLVPSRG